MGSFSEIQLARTMRLALRLAKRALGETSPNPMVGAVLVNDAGEIIGRGWHRRAGSPHAEIEAIQDAAANGASLAGASLFVTLEPCCTHGRTPPCVDAIIRARIGRVIAAATDPNPLHAGRGFDLLREAGVKVTAGVLESEARRLNEAFEFWIQHRRPFVTVKAAMTLDGKIATVGGESKWITSETSRRWAMKLRRSADAILAGVNTVIADDPSLTYRPSLIGAAPGRRHELRRIVLDTEARTPLRAAVVADEAHSLTTVVVGEAASKARVKALSERVRVWVAPLLRGKPDLGWVLGKLGEEQVTHVLAEGGGEAHASLFEGGWVQRAAFFYAPLVVGGGNARRSVGGAGAGGWPEIVKLENIEHRRLGPDLFVTGRVASK